MWDYLLPVALLAVLFVGYGLGFRNHRGGCAGCNDCSDTSECRKKERNETDATAER